MKNISPDDGEFRPTKDEFTQSDGIKEFNKNGKEYFQEQPYIADHEKKPKRDWHQLRRASTVLVCAAVITVAPHTIKAAKADALPAEEPAVIAQETISELQRGAEAEMETQPEASVNVINQILLTSGQTEYINRVWKAFEADDQETLGELVFEETFSSFCQGELNGKVFLPNDNSLHERTSFNGTGLIFSATEFQENGSEAVAGYIFCGELTMGQAQGRGKIINYTDTYNKNYHGIYKKYFLGTFEQGKATGEGSAYCNHETDFFGEFDDGHQSHFDEGHGVFKNGFLSDGSGLFHWKDEEFENAEEVRNESYENGIKVNATSRYIGFDDGRNEIIQRPVGKPQDHFGVSTIRVK